ncbi:MAG: phosphotransferase family protein [Halieaceae bacterium]|nr:phosphotransferase family protein [Halieaceae bacterium]
MQIETVIAPGAAEKYLDEVRRLLAEVDQTLTAEVVGGESENSESIREIGAQLQKLADKPDPKQFETFLALTAKLQKFLTQSGVSSAGALAQSLMRADSEYAQTLFSSGLELAKKAETDNKSGATNQLSYDETALLNFIVDQFPGNEGAEIENSGFIPGGQSKFTLSIDLSGVKTLPRNLILRSDASGRFSGASVGYEYRLLKILYDRGVRVPKPLALEETGAIFGAPFMLSERASGATIGHMFNLPAQDKATLIDVARNLATIHKIAPGEFGDSIDNAKAPTSDKFLSWLELGQRDLAQTDRQSATFELAFSWLKEHAKMNDRAPRVLVHGDYGLNNLLIEDSRVMAILDWEFAHMGNPAYDLGYFYFMARALGSWELFLEAYQNSGIPLPDEDQLNYSILFGATRLGVQCAQATSAFNARLIGGSDAARVVSHQYFNESILRISEAMELVHQS